MVSSSQSAPVTNFSPEIVRPPLLDVAVKKIPAFASLDPVTLKAELPSLLLEELRND